MKELLGFFSFSFFSAMTTFTYKYVFLQSNVYICLIDELSNEWSVWSYMLSHNTNN